MKKFILALIASASLCMIRSENNNEPKVVNDDVPKNEQKNNNENSIDEINNVFVNVIPLKITDVIREYPLQSIATVAIAARLVPKVAFWGTAALVFVGYKATDKKFADTVDKKITQAKDFVRNKWEDLSENYLGKKQK